MTARTPPKRGAAASSSAKKPVPLTVSRVLAMGHEVADFVDATGIGERCVERVEVDDVILDLGSRLIAVPRRYLPAEVTEGQWVRFTRRGENLHAEIDMKATLDGQSKLSGLFARLTLTDDE